LRNHLTDATFNLVERLYIALEARSLEGNRRLSPWLLKSSTTWYRRQRAVVAFMIRQNMVTESMRPTCVRRPTEFRISLEGHPATVTAV
jgi:hypothetical protein